MVKKLFKKGIGLLLSVAMLISLLPAHTLAADTIATTYGLSSSNSLVQVLDDAIAVFSHPLSNQSAYFVTSANVTAALTSSKDYTISYVNANKEAVAESNVTDGFVKLSKDGDDEYIPVVTKGAEISFSSTYFTAPDGYKDDFSTNGTTYDGTANLQLGSLGGKSAEDTAYALIAGDTALTAGRALRLQIPDIVNAQIARPYTIEFNMYVDGNASSMVKIGFDQTKGHNWELLEIADNKLYYNNTNGGYTNGLKETNGAPSVSYTKGQWKRVAITWDGFYAGATGSKTVARNRVFIYIDGEEVAIDTNCFGLSNLTRANRVAFCINPGSQNGVVAFDDFDAYYGYYRDGASDVITPASQSTLKFNTTNKTASHRCSAVSDVVTAAKEATGGAYAQVFTDSTLTTVATELSDSGNVLVVTSPGGAYDYYALSKASDVVSPSDVEGLSSNNVLVELLDSAIAVYSHPSDKGLMVGSSVVASSLSADGYTFEHVNAEKEAASDASVTNGYIKCIKDGESPVYVPIVTQGNSLIDKLTNTPDSGTDVSYALEGGLGGKDADDTAYAFTAGASGISDGKSFGFANLGTDELARPFTVEFNMYIEGDASASLRCGTDHTDTNETRKNSFDLYKATSDGRIYYNDKEKDGYTGGLVTGGAPYTTYAKGQWKHIVITWDGYKGEGTTNNASTPVKHRYVTYVDGVPTSWNGYLRNSANRFSCLYFCVTGGSAGSKVAFDDIKAYNGYYYGADDYTIKATNTVGLDGVNGVVYYDSSLTTDAALVSALEANDDIDTVKFLTGETKTLMTVKGDVYSYYTVFSNSVYRPITFKVSAANIIAASAINYGDADAELPLIIAAYNASSELIGIDICNATVAKGVVTASVPYSEGNVYKAFLRGADLITPILFETYSAN